MPVMLRRLTFVALCAVLLGVLLDAAAAMATRSADGLIAFHRRVGSTPAEIWVMNPDGSGKRFLARGDDYQWSPDGRWIAFDRDDGLYVINRDGRALRRLVEASVASPTWSPDGTQIAIVTFAAGGGLAVVDVAGGGVRQLTRGEDESPVWSPQGMRIAFMRWTGDRFKIAAIDADGTHRRFLTTDSYNAHNPAWSPDGRRLAFQGNFHGDVGDWDLYVMNADGSALTNLTVSDAPSEASPKWSPNGQWIAFESRNARRYNPDIHAIRANGTRHRNLTRSPRSPDSGASWSPDGKSLVFTSVRDGKRDIYPVRASGRDVMNLTNAPPGTRNADPVWSP
jgi:Tol biopolymer transport system component